MYQRIAMGKINGGKVQDDWSGQSDLGSECESNSSLSLCDLIKVENNTYFWKDSPYQVK